MSVPTTESTAIDPGGSSSPTTKILYTSILQRNLPGQETANPTCLGPVKVCQIFKAKNEVLEPLGNLMVTLALVHQW